MFIIDKIKKWYSGVDPFELLAIVFIVIGIVAIIIVFLSSSFSEFFDDETRSINEYSELIGGFVGSLWALAGVLLFYASLASQQKDIEEQRNLLVRQIDEVVKQTVEFRKQYDIQSKQQYENTYFQLLKFHNDIITSIILEINDLDFVTGTNKIRQITGRKSFVEYYDIYKRFFNTQLEILMSGELSISIIQKIVDNSYRQFYDEYQADLGHYFRNLYNILYFVDNLEDDEKSKFYLELLHAQLSNYELALLYFHCACTSNSEFKILLEKYEILSTLPDDEIISMSKKLYTPKAFGKDDFDDEDNVYSNDFNSDSLNRTKSNSENDLDDFEISFSENDILSKFAKMSKSSKNNDFDDLAVNFENYNDKKNKVEDLKDSVENDNLNDFDNFNIKEESYLLNKLKNLSNSSKDEFDIYNDDYIDENYFINKDDENNDNEVKENLIDNNMNDFKDIEKERQLNLNNHNLLNKIKNLPADANFIENPEIEDGFDFLDELSNDKDNENKFDDLKINKDLLNSLKSVKNNNENLNLENFNNFDEIETIEELKNISKLYNEDLESSDIFDSISNDKFPVDENIFSLSKEEVLEKAKGIKLDKLSNLFTKRNK